MGIGFAIPINMAKRVREQLVEKGQVTRGQIGAYIQDMTQELAESFGLEEAEGVLISQVIEDSPAEKAGLRQGDVILEADGKKVGKVGTFRNRIALTAPGTRVTFGILRDGKRKDVVVTVGRLETDERGRLLGSGSLPKLGLSLQELTPELAERFGYEGETGVLVTSVEPGSVGQRAGIERGSLLQEIDRKAVTTPERARKLLQQGRGKTHLLLIRKGPASQYLTLKIEE